MRKLIFALFIALMFLMPVVGAVKTVVYVTGAENCWHIDCDCLNDEGYDEDYSFCTELEDLGYNVIIETEGNVISDSDEWKDDVAGSNLIFLGDVSEAAADSTNPVFCENIEPWVIPPRRTVFAGFISSHKDTDNDLEGCAFYLGMASYGGVKNTCSRKKFPVIEYGYITEKYKIGDILPIYPVDYEVNLHDVDGGWVGVNCDPGTGTTTYPLLNTVDKGAFWGLNNPSKFNDDGWYLFDRTIWTILSDDTWVITPVIIPENSTADDRVWVTARITMRGELVKTGTVNFTVNGVLKGKLTYNSITKHWENKTTIFSPEDVYIIRITGYSGSGLRGFGQRTLTAGNLTVNITSGNYVPGLNYIISANFKSGIDPQAASANYRIRDYTNLSSILKEGILGSCTGNTCEGIITDIPDWGKFILEVDAYNNSITKTGGSFKIINISEELNLVLTTDKDTYIPGNKIIIDLYTDTVASEANLSIIKPDNTYEIENLPMTKVNDTHWNKNYTLGTTAQNGSYVINVKAYSGSRSSEENKTVDVIAWKLFKSLNKYFYEPGENVEITIQTLNVYDPLLNFSIFLDLSDPYDNVSALDNGTIMGSGTFNTTYEIPLTSTGGTYNVIVFVNDSDGRNRTTNMTFSVTSTGLISVDPPQWVIQRLTPGTETQEFIVYNTGVENLTDIDITTGGDLADDILLSDDFIALLIAGDSVNFTASIDVSEEGERNGTITVGNNLTEFVVEVNLSYQSDLNQSFLSTSPSYISVITIPDEIESETISIANLGTQTATDITTSVSSDLSGIVTVISKPSQIGASDEEDMTIEIDTDGLDEGMYDGTLTISSSVGDADVDVSIEILGDLVYRADQELSNLYDLQANITILKQQGRNVTTIENLFSATESLLESVKTAYRNGDYPTAKSNLDQAVTNINNLRAQISSLQGRPGPDYSWIVWLFAFIIVLVILGILGYKYKDKIMELINKYIFKKEKPKEEEEGYYYPERGGYRTEYY